MKKLELKDIISLLTPKEFKRFGDYIRSPFFNVPERITALYSFIEPNYEKVISGSYSRSRIGEKVLKGSPSPEYIRKLYSEFNKEIEKFLTFLEYESDKDYRTIALIRQLRRKRDEGLNDNSENNPVRLTLKLAEAEKEVQSMPPDINSYRRALAVYEEISQAEPSSGFHKYSASLQNESDMLDAFYITSKLMKFQVMFSKQQLNKQPLGYRWDMYDQIWEFIEKNKGRIKKNLPDVYIKYLMTKMAVSKNDGLIMEYGLYLESLEGTLSGSQLADYYSDLYNYMSIRIGEGRHELRAMQMDLFKFLDKKDLLYDVPGGKIHTYTYKQVADTAFHVKDFSWAEYFLEKYSGLVDSPERKDIVNLLHAKLFYFKNETQKARIRLAKVDYCDYIHYLDAKMLLLCIEYDDKNFIESSLITDSLDKYLKSHADIPESVVNNTRSFIYYVKVILNLKENGADDFMTEKLMEVLRKDERPVYARKWLAEKLEELRAQCG